MASAMPLGKTPRLRWRTLPRGEVAAVDGLDQIVRRCTPIECRTARNLGNQDAKLSGLSGPKINPEGHQRSRPANGQAHPVLTPHRQMSDP